MLGLHEKKTKLRPSVGFSLSKEFNDVVAVDLKAPNDIHILHIIDHATQLSTAPAIAQFTSHGRYNLQ